MKVTNFSNPLESLGEKEKQIVVVLSSITQMCKIYLPSTYGEKPIVIKPIVIKPKRITKVMPPCLCGDEKIELTVASIVRLYIQRVSGTKDVSTLSMTLTSKRNHIS